MKSKLLAVMMDRQEKTMKHVAECLYAKSRFPLENQAEWLRNHPVEYYIGMADGVNNMLEDALHSSREYKGFHYIHFAEGFTEPQYVPHRGEDITKEPEFQEWCRRYR